MDVELIIWACVLPIALVIAFLLARKFKEGLFHKILGGLVVTVAVSTVFYYLAVILVLFIGFLRHGI